MMKIYLLTIIIGFILEMLGADILVKQNICFAKITKIPKIYIAMILCGMGSGLSYLIYIIIQSLQKNNQMIPFHTSITVLSGILLILGICAMTGKMKIYRGVMQQDFSYLIFVEIILLYLSADYLFHGKHSMRILSGIDGVILFAFFVVYLYIIGKKTYRGIMNDKNVKIDLTAILFCGLGIIITTAGGIMMLLSVNKIVIPGLLKKYAGKEFIKILIMIIPNIYISIWSIKNREPDLIMGNLLGYSMTCLTGAVGVAAMINPIVISVSGIYNMIILCCGSIMVWLFAYKDQQLNRFHGCVMGTVFVVYMVSMVMR
jgi:cation:H+ antiporter